MLGERIYFVNAFGEVDCLVNWSPDVVKRLKAIGNAFPTAEEAVRALQAIKAALNGLRNN